MDQYTEKLANHGQDFDEFILLCARDVGHLEHMRGRPVDEVPEELMEYIPTINIKSAEATVKNLNDATNEKKRDAVVTAYLKERNTELDQDIADVELEMDRYNAMSNKIIAWEPKPEYASVKNIAMKKLATSTQDALDKHIRLKAIRGANVTYDTMFQALCEQASRDLENAKAEEKAGNEKHEQSSKWINGLLEDLQR